MSFLAAVVLYLLAVGGVRGFAFTLGLTTVIDLIVVFLFTKPMVTLLARTRFFGGGHRLSGFDAAHLGRTVAYAGRGRVRTPVARVGPCPRTPGPPPPAARPSPSARQRASGRGRTCRRHVGSRRRDGGVLMCSFARFGNDLYTGRRSYDFVGNRRTLVRHRRRRRPAVACCCSGCVGSTSGIEFTRRRRSSVSPGSRRPTPRWRRRPCSMSPPTPAARRSPRSATTACACRPSGSPTPQTDEVAGALAEAYGVDAGARHVLVRRPDLGAGRHREGAAARSWSSSRSSALVIALYFRTWKMAVGRARRPAARPGRHRRDLRRWSGSR